MVIGFAKNRAISYQDEINAGYYGQKQITMHPIYIYCMTKTSESTTQQRQSHVFSDKN
jgi:hypothetical protein